MANVGDKGVVKYCDTFATVTLGTGLIGLDGGTNYSTTSYGMAWVQSLDTGDTSFTITQDAARGRHVAGSLGTTDNDLIEFNGASTMFYGSCGFQAIEALVMFDVCTGLAFNFGFSDDVTEASATLPVECSATSFASSASTYCGIVFDTDATDNEPFAFWTDDDVDSTESYQNLRMKGLSLTPSKWLWMRVELQDRGSGTGGRATFHVAHDGKHVTKEFNTTVDNDAALCWYFGAENRNTTAKGVYIKLPSWEQSIAD